MQAASVVLFILGAALEIAGILLVVAELRSDRKHALEIAGISIPRPMRDPLEDWPKSTSWTIQGAIDKDRQLAPQRAQAETSRKLQRALIDVLEGNRQFRVVGVGLLVSGVLISTIANLLATV